MTKKRLGQLVDCDQSVEGLVTQSPTETRSQCSSVGTASAERPGQSVGGEPAWSGLVVRRPPGGRNDAGSTPRRFGSPFSS